VIISFIFAKAPSDIFSAKANTSVGIDHKKGEKVMMNTVLAIENRINLLKGRDPVANASIIKKLERRLRKLMY
jgi:hypothetical protein